MKVYTTTQITKALSLVNQGFTRKEAAKKAKIGVYSLNYYLAKKSSPKTRKILLNKSHIAAIRKLSTLLRNGH